MPEKIVCVNIMIKEYNLKKEIIMKISVLGCGRWGTFIAWYLDKIGHQITLYGRE